MPVHEMAATKRRTQSSLLAFSLVCAAASARFEHQTNIVLTTPAFSLSIEPSTCLTTATFRNTTSAAVPFLSLYNRIADARPNNLDPCVSAALVGPDIVRVEAAHGAGSVDIRVDRAPDHLVFEVLSLERWTGSDPVERHIAFGEFWHDMAGFANVAENPPVMGKLQGPYGTPGSSITAAAGYMTLSNSSYYRYIFYASPGQRVAFAFCRTLDVANTWIAVGRRAGVDMLGNANRFKTWWWTPWTEATREKHAQRARTMGIDILVNSEGWETMHLTVNSTVFPSGINDTADYFRGRGVDVGLHMHPDIVWPCVDGRDIACLSTGVGISPVFLECPECMLPEGLAPTYRSGQPNPLKRTATTTTEDLGFWWGHEKNGTTAYCGNPKPCGQGTCNYNDWVRRWGANMTLFGTHWSTAGVYRSGGAIGFNGTATGSHGVVPYFAELDTARQQMTLGAVVHLFDGDEFAAMTTGSGSQCIAHRPGVLSLCFEDADSPVKRTLVWSVFVRAEGAGAWCNTSTTTTAFHSGTPYVVKATFNSTAGSGLKLFVDGKLDGHAPHCADVTIAAAPGADLVFGARSLGRAPHGDGSGSDSSTHLSRAHIVTDGFAGALEEIYVKNVSAEHRTAYLYADDNRLMGTFLIDLTRAPGRALFSRTINSVLDQFNPGAVQYDGFEKLQLIAGQDFGHSPQTFTSGLWRGNPTPDWYHYEGWPLRWGIGILQGIEQTHAAMNSRTAVECSFMAPGLGPWRPDMAPYVDEHGADLVALGLEWHAKMLLRIEIAGTLINSYDTYDRWLQQNAKEGGAFPLEYWLGGLITGGLAFQPSGAIDEGQEFDEQIGRWMARYRRYGHAVEDGVRTLYYDAGCCHIQGTCEWVACRDVVASRLVGGTWAAPATGLYIAQSENGPIHLPDEWFPRSNVTVSSSPTLPGALLVFLAYNLTSAAIDFGRPADRVVALVPTAATNLTAANRSLLLGGGFFDLSGEDVLARTVHENGTLVHQRWLFGSAQSGQRSYRLPLHNDGDAVGELTVMLEKHRLSK